MNKTGIVMKVENKKACIMTEDGQFLNVVVKDKVPSIGEVYSAPVAVPIFSLKRAATAAALIFTVLAGSLTYTYNAEAANIVFKGDPEIRLGVNRWNMIIKAEALNKNGEKVLSSINIKNKSLNTGLYNIVSESERENNVTKGNNTNADNKKEIKVFVGDSKTGNVPSLDEFQKRMKQNNINIVVENEKAKNENTSSNRNDNNQSSSQVDKANQEIQTVKTQNNVPGSNKNNDNNGNSVDMKKKGSGNTNSSEYKQSINNQNINKNNSKHSTNDNKNHKFNGNEKNKEEDKSKGNH